MERVNPYASFLDQVSKPARYIGGEHNILIKDWSKVRVKIALCFPDVYEIGMSHLGMKILYDQLNRVDDIVAERVFTPWPDMEELLRLHQLPLVALESYRPLREFDILGFSLQHELSYTNVLTMLDLGGVALWQEERKESDPFIIGGGPCATHPEAIAPFFDFFVIGDGEELFVRLAYFIAGARESGVSRYDILAELSLWQGIYVPSMFSTAIDEIGGYEYVCGHKQNSSIKKVNRFVVNSLAKYPFPTKSPIPHLTAIFDRFSVELSRGCTEGCRFCQAGMIYRPVRERSPDEIINSVIEGIREGGFNEASLTCLSTADYSAITPLLLDLLDRVQKENATLGLSSLRAYGMEPQVFDKLASVQKSALTFAPEAGTARLRKVINKNISEDDLLSTTEAVFSRGWQKMKLYFMIGLPTETDEDVKGIMDTAYRALQIGQRFAGKKTQVTVSVSSFVPKPHTPFQWAKMIDVEEIERKQEILWELAKEYRIKFRKHFSRESILEGVLARGDRRVADAIYAAWKDGARFDGWQDCFSYDRWEKAFDQQQINTTFYLNKIRTDAKLPWGHIDIGLEEKFLLREWQLALKDRMSPPCGKPADRIVHYSNLEELQREHEEEGKKLVCYHCGIACDLSGMVTQRKNFLSKLGAVNKSDYQRPHGIERRRNKNATKVIGGVTYRIRFAKLGPICFISHLDMQKIMMRIFRRAKIEVLWTHGYNPHPYISLGPALSLGINSLNEFFDVRVKDTWGDMAEVLKKLNDCSERGLLFKEIISLSGNKHSIQKNIRQFHYFLPLCEGYNQQLVEDKCQEILLEKELIIQSFNKKSKSFVEKNVRDKLVDLGIKSLALSTLEEELIREINADFNLQGVLAIVDAPEGRGIRPSELEKLLRSRGIPIGRIIKLETKTFLA